MAIVMTLHSIKKLLVKKKKKARERAGRRGQGRARAAGLDPPLFSPTPQKRSSLAYANG